MKHDDSIQGSELLRMVRERLMRQMESGSPQSVINNYAPGGGAGHEPMSGGLMEKMGGGAGGISPEDMDYLVDIERDDKLDPLTGAKLGWTKKVHRYAQKKKT